MPTLRQKKVAKKIVEALESNETPSAKAVLESVGYGTGLQNQPKRVLESEGVKEELTNLGFTVDGADSVVSQLLYGGTKEESKLKAADMIYKRLGAYAAEKSVNLNLTADAKDLANPKLIQVKERYEEEMRKQLET